MKDFHHLHFPRSFVSTLKGTEDLLGEHDSNLVLRRDGEGNISMAQDVFLESNQLGNLKREGVCEREISKEGC